MHICIAATQISIMEINTVKTPFDSTHRILLSFYNQYVDGVSEVNTLLTRYLDKRTSHGRWEISTSTKDVKHFI